MRLFFWERMLILWNRRIYQQNWDRNEAGDDLSIKWDCLEQGIQKREESFWKAGADSLFCFGGIERQILSLYDRGRREGFAKKRKRNTGQKQVLEKGTRQYLDMKAMGLQEGQCISNKQKEWSVSAKKRGIEIKRIRWNQIIRGKQKKEGDRGFVRACETLLLRGCSGSESRKRRLSFYKSWGSYCNSSFLWLQRKKKAPLTVWWMDKKKQLIDAVFA